VAVIPMGASQRLSGHVESLSGGIADRDRTTSSNLLSSVNPTFNWVRLAQRIPVRIKLDALPAGARLVAGQTVTVDVQAKHS
jgi:multidrug resistance efflux pump